MKLNKHIIGAFLCFLLILNKNFAQRTNTVTAKSILPAPKSKDIQFTRFGLRAGVNIGVLYLGRNTKEKNNEPGFCGGLTYDVNNFIRLSALYSHFKPVNILPTWQNIKANTFEINLEIIARFPNKKTILYPLVGLSYNRFSGYFTGQKDYLNLKNYYTINSTVTNNWLGLNVGTGLEHNFGIVGLYIDYRMRVGKEERAYNIMDVCYTAGIKIRFPYGKLSKKYLGTNNRYHIL